MAKINVIEKRGGKVYGCKVFICGNCEVIADRAGVGSDPSGNGWKDETLTAFVAAARMLEDAGFDYREESEFRTYNGGPRKALIEADWYAGDICDVDDPDSEIVWKLRLHPRADIPADIYTKVESAIDDAIGVMCDAMKAECA